MATPIERIVAESGIALIKRFYQCELTAHKDFKSGNKPYRIGYGSKDLMDGEPVEMGNRLKDEKEADALLRTQILEEYIPQLEMIPQWFDFTDNQRGALISFAWCHSPYFYGTPDYRAISSVLRYKKTKEVPEVIRFYNKEKGRATTRMVAWRKAEAKLWESLSSNSLENRILVVQNENVVKAGEPFTLIGSCSPGWEGTGVNITVDGEKQHKRPDRPLVNPEGRWEYETCFEKPGEYEVRVIIDGYKKFVTIKCIP